MANQRKINLRRNGATKSRVRKVVLAEKQLCTVRFVKKVHGAQADDGEDDKPKRPQTQVGEVRLVASIKNVTTGLFFVELEYFDLNGSIKRSIEPRSILDSVPKLRKSLLDLGAILSAKTNLADLTKASPPIRAVTHQTGFHGDELFVLPKRTYGDAERSLTYQAEGQDTSRRGESQGTLKQWLAGIKGPLNASSFLCLAAGTAFAAPLASLIAVEETAVTHVNGISATGKTLMAKFGESIMGPSAESNLTTLNRTARALNDQIAAHDGTMININELKNNDGKLKAFLPMLSHVLTSGTGFDRADVAKRGNRDLRQKRWTVMGITSMERSIDSVMNGKRDMGERVRHIDLPVPPRHRGGIFDQTGLRPAAKARARAGELAAELAAAIEANYGVAFAAFIEHVLNNRRSVAKRFGDLSECFVELVAASGDPWDRRLARKFGYMYAGAVIAIDAGVLPLDQKLCVRMFRKMYRKARGVFQTPDEQAKKVIEQLIEAAGDGTNFPIIAKGKAAPSLYDDCRGFRRKSASGLELAVKGQVFREWCNSADVRALVVERLKKANALQSGHSAADTRLIQMEGAGRHRYYLIDVGRLKIA